MEPPEQKRGASDDERSERSDEPHLYVGARVTECVGRRSGHARRPCAIRDRRLLARGVAGRVARCARLDHGIERVAGLSRRGCREQSHDEQRCEDHLHVANDTPRTRLTGNYYPHVPTADLGDIAMSYSEHGDGAPVLGIMGYALDKRFWGPQIPAVTATNRFVIFDNRGMGRSTGGAPTSIDQMADDTVRLLDHVGIEETIVFGASMGGAIAQRLTLDHPDRVKALILTVSFARSTEFMKRQHAVMHDLLGVDGWTRQKFVEVSLIRMFTPQFFEVGTEVIDQLVRAVSLLEEREEWHPEVLQAQLDAMDKFDHRDELPRITCPTLVIGARLDFMAPIYASEELAAGIPKAELHVLETGHGCMIEEMDAFNALVSDFLRHQNAS